MNKVFLACYRGRGDKLAHRLCDGITRFLLVANTVTPRLPSPCLTVVTNAIHQVCVKAVFAPK